MIADGQEAVWPMPGFHFAVAINGERLNVSEVSGLAVMNGDNGSRPGKLVLRRGIFAGDLTFWRWFEDAVASESKSWTVTIDLLDEMGASVRCWTLSQARPVKFSGPHLRADSNEVAIEEMELACETVSISIPDCAD